MTIPSIIDCVAQKFQNRLLIVAGQQNRVDAAAGILPDVFIAALCEVYPTRHKSSDAVSEAS